jgi:serine/threonine protein kinase
MAEVWVARQIGKHGFEKLVAIKTILPQFASDDRFQQMFLNEAQLASRIHHTNVAKVLDLGEENEVLYIAMEWIDGEPVNRMQRALTRAKVTLPTGIILRIMADVSAGLHAAHEVKDRDGTPAGVVHRDVSPHNILTSMDGVSKVIDFGIARAIARAAGELTQGTLKGKIHYMAPEQAMGQPVDRRADVWSVGAVLYNFFAGHPPYDGETQLQMLHKLTSGLPPPRLPVTVPLPISSVIQGALRHDPSQRWATTEEIQLRLEHAMVEIGRPTPTSAVAAFMAEHFGNRSAARHRTVEAAIAALRAQDGPAPRATDPPPSRVAPSPPSAASSSGLVDVPAHTPVSQITGARLGSASGVGPLTKEPSSASIGSTAMDSAPPAKRGRRSYVLAGFVTVAISALGAAFVLRPDVVRRATRAANALVPTTAPSAPPPSSSPVASAAAPPVPASSQPPNSPAQSSSASSPASGAPLGPEPETIAVTDLPLAAPSSSAPDPAPPPRAKPQPPRAPSPPPKPTVSSPAPAPLPPPSRKVNDDGF